MHNRVQLILVREHKERRVKHRGTKTASRHEIVDTALNCIGKAGIQYGNRTITRSLTNDGGEAHACDGPFKTHPDVTGRRSTSAL